MRDMSKLENALVRAGLGPFKVHAAGTLASARCPECGESAKDRNGDRFRIMPNSANGKGGYVCNACGAHGDGIAALMRYCGMSYPEACKTLDITPRSRTYTRHMNTGANTSRRTRPAVSSPATQAIRGVKEPTLPSPQWQVQAEALCNYLDTRLPLAEYDRRQGRIGYDRGLDSVECWRRFSIVWNPSDIYQRPELWGLSGNKILIPEGVIVAVRRRTGIQSLIVRCEYPERYGEKACKLRMVRGGAVLPYVLGQYGLPVILLESALDAALVYRECRGQVSVVATNGANWPLTPQAVKFIKAAPQAMYWCDADEAGFQAFAFRREALPGLRAMRNPKQAGKDVGDLYKLNRDKPGQYPSVLQWIEACGVFGGSRVAA